MGGRGGGEPAGQTQQHQRHAQGHRTGLEESVHLVICIPPLVRLEISCETIKLRCCPRYGFANVLLILGAVREIRLMLVVWMLATLTALVWEFVLLSILFSYDTTVGQIRPEKYFNF